MGTRAAAGPDFPELAEHLTGHNPRGSWSVTSDGTWSTRRDLPSPASSTTAGIAMAVADRTQRRLALGDRRGHRRRLLHAVRADRHRLRVDRSPRPGRVLHLRSRYGRFRDRRDAAAAG